MTSEIAQANKNIRLYVLIKVFVKRVFLPLTAIYFVSVDHFTIREIGLLVAMSSAVQIFAEVPTGYFADRFARITSIRIGAFCNIVSTLMYVFVHIKLGVAAAYAIEAIGYSFLGGAGEALIYDSLKVKKQEHEYSKVVSRAQSISLIINAGLLATIPLTYRIDKRLPFAIGTLAYLILFITACFMRDVGREHAEPVGRPKVSFKLIHRNRNIIAFGLLFGIVCTYFTGVSDLFNLTLKDIGIKPELLGLLFSGASLFGAALGPFIHQLKRLGIYGYMLFDCGMAILPMFAAYTHVAVLFATSWLVSMSFWRYRRIIYQEHLLTIFPTNYKASLVSGMNFTEDIATLWVPVVATTVISAQGYYRGFGTIGLAALILVPLYMLSARRLFASARSSK